MHRRRWTIGCSLALLLLAVGLLFLTGPAVLLRPTKAQQEANTDLHIHLYREPANTEPFAPGNEIKYEIYFVNWSSTAANGVRVIVTLPEHTTYISSSGPGFFLIQAGPGQVVWARDYLASFERGWLSFTVRVDDDAPVGAEGEAGAHIWCLDSESNYDNNESFVKQYVWPAEPDLQITQHLWQDSDPVAAGNEIVYEIVPENRGGSTASSVRISDTLPADCAYISDNATGSGYTTVMTGSTVVWTRAGIEPVAYDVDPEKLFVHCQVAGTWTPDQWLENLVEISTPDPEYDYNNNLSRWVYKPESDRRYGAAVTSLDDRTMRLLSEGGFDYMLYYLDWSETEPEDGAYRWDALDFAVWQAWRYNLRLVVRVDRAPDWIRGPGTASAPPGNPDKLGQFLQAAAARWPRQPGNPEGTQVYGYVIWNEPNLAAEWGGNAPDAAVYTDLLQAAYNGVKAASPDAWVISAGLATTNGSPPQSVDDRAYLQQMYDAGAGSFFDYLGANPMGFAYAPDDASDPNGYNFSRALSWRSIMEANGDGAKAILATETGWLRDTPIDLGSDYNWIKVSAIDQAHYLSRAYHKAHCEWGDWMGPMVTWNLDFAAGNYSQAEHPYWFAVTDHNRDPLRSYLTLQNATRGGPADLWLEKALIDPVQVGQDLQYVIHYTNIGGQTATGVVMTDTLPAGTEYQGDTGGGTLLPGGDQVVWDLGDVDICTFGTITLTLHLNDVASSSGRVTNRVEANHQPGEPYTDDNVAVVTSHVPGLGIHKSVVPIVAGPGQAITYTLTFSNTGPEPAAGVVITDVVPITLTDISYDHSGVVVTPTGTFSYAWQVEDLAQSRVGVITISGVVDPGVSGIFSLTNRATITTTTEDLYRGDNTSVVSSTIDAEPPVPPVLASPANGAAVSDSAPILSWQASLSADAAGYLMDFGGTVLDVGNVTQHGPGILADGAYVWTMAAYDGVGNVGAYTDTWSFSVDTEIPAPPSLTSPADGVLIGDPSPTLTWNASPSADAAGYLLDLDGVLLDVGSVTQYSTALLADGAHTWTVATYDAAGNSSPYTDTWAFSVDTAPPQAPALASPADGSVTGDNTQLLVWSASPSPDVAGYFLNLDGTSQDVGNVTQLATGVLADGVHTWTVAAYDAVGNTSTYTDTWSFTVDTTAPDPPALAIPPDGAATGDDTPLLAWSASPSPDVAGYRLNLDGAMQDVGHVTQYTAGPLAGGAHTWTVAAYDAVGNASAYTDTWSFSIDTVSPVPPVLASPIDGATLADDTPTIAWQVSASVDVVGYLVDLDGSVLDVGDVVHYTADPLADGAHTWSVAAYDAANNTSAYTDTWSFVVDTAAPNAPLLVSPADGAVFTNTTPTLIWQAGPGLDVTGYLLNLDGTVLDVGDAVQHTTGVLADGVHTWTVAAYDAVGNTGAYTDTWLFTVDTTAPPPPPLVSPGDGDSTGDSTPTLMWQASSAADVAGYLLDLDGAVSDVGDATQYTSGLLADGPYTWTVAAYDVLGNIGAYTDTWSFTVDTTAPAPPALIGPADGASTSDRTPVLTWGASPDADVAGYLLHLDGVMIDAGDVTSYTAGPLDYGAHTWTAAAYDAVGNASAYTDAWYFTTRPDWVYLPVVVKGVVSAPDLVVERLVVTNNDVQVVLRNQGNVAALADFWVDVYIDPDPIPTAVNQIWPALADEGLVWGVTADLQPGQALTLTVGGDHYVDEYSQVARPLANGTPVYAQVDSAHAGTTYGAVLESHEISGGSYKNIGGPAYPAAAGSNGLPSPPPPGNLEPVRALDLPPRR